MIDWLNQLDVGTVVAVMVIAWILSGRSSAKEQEDVNNRERDRNLNAALNRVTEAQDLTGRVLASWAEQATAQMRDWPGLGERLDR